MRSLLIGIVLIGAAVAAILPAGLGWGQEVIVFFKGFLPIFAIFAGLITVLVGIADIKDRLQEKKEAGRKDTDEPPRAS